METNKLRLSQVAPVKPNGFTINVQGITLDMQLMTEACRRMVPDLAQRINEVVGEKNKREAFARKAAILEDFKLAYGFNPLEAPKAGTDKKNDTGDKIKAPTVDDTLVKGNVEIKKGPDSKAQAKPAAKKDGSAVKGSQPKK